MIGHVFLAEIFGIFLSEQFIEVFASKGKPLGAARQQRRDDGKFARYDKGMPL